MKKGFTLIELLAVIILLAIIALIAYPTLNNVISKNKDKLYEKQIDELERHTNTWIMDHANTFELENGDSYLLSFEEMYNSGLLNVKEVKDPRNSENIKGCMVITRNNANYDIKYSEECKATYDCTFDGELVQGAEFIDGQYTYRYMQEVTAGGGWINITNDGWGVKLTDKNATAPVITRTCSTINSKPIVSMAYMFSNSKTESVALNKLDTSNVINMEWMFGYTKIADFDFSALDISNVTNMSYMFSNMFYGDNGSHNFSLKGLDASNVTKMDGMFSGNCGDQFVIDSLDLIDFNTSNVENMSNMFGCSKAQTINLGNKFDTSKVTNMQSMFANASVSNIDLSNFNTSNVVRMDSMFVGSQIPILDLSSFDTSKATNMGLMFDRAIATIGYARTQSDVDKFNATSYKPDTLTFTVK